MDFSKIQLNVQIVMAMRQKLSQLFKDKASNLVVTHTRARKHWLRFPQRSFEARFPVAMGLFVATQCDIAPIGIVYCCALVKRIISQILVKCQAWSQYAEQVLNKKSGSRADCSKKGHCIVTYCNGSNSAHFKFLIIQAFHSTVSILLIEETFGS